MGDKDDKIKRIEQLIELMKKNDLVELEIKNDDDKILLKRAQPQQPQQLIAAPMVAHPSAPSAHADTASAAGVGDAQTPSDLIEITAPMVGTFYAKPNPDSELFVDIGANVSSSTVVCIIEAMKVMNEIKSGTEGTIEEVCVKNGQAVEYGQVLFRVKPV